MIMNTFRWTPWRISRDSVTMEDEWLMRETGMIQFLSDTEPADYGFSSVPKVSIYPYDVYTLGVFVLFLVENKRTYKRNY